MTGPAAGDGPRTPLVLKFGGSAFAELEGFTRVARYVADRAADSGRPVVVVVSAMSGTTGRLKETLERLAPDPPPEAAAMLLTSGETVSVALLTAVLDMVGLRASPVAAAGTGLLAEGPPQHAALLRADPAPLTAALAARPVAVVPGGRAVTAAGRSVMLGRNSSDLSAVALAGALSAPVCELFSDVPGICTADPYLVPAARTLEHVAYETVRRMSHHGAKVVHTRAVDWAERHGVLLHCRPLPPGGGAGTVVGQGPPAPAVVVSARDDGLARITTLREDGPAEHTLVPAADAADRARRAHRELFPDAAEDAPPVPPKARSAYSDVLIT
ncbi:aspartate kinase [Streptomyces sp. NPDC046215]|uniref:amino acid kinase family protein n=1 Tax=Streptomyces sp. NPDC046215 TaxID=3155774 RepID=UPI00340601A6